MPTVNTFEELKSWQKARRLAKEIPEVTRRFEDDFDLKRQIRRSSGSAMDNIAEGFGRGSRGEFVQFLGIAKGSAEEVKSQLYRALDNIYITKEEFDHLYQQADDVGKLIAGLLKYLNTSDIKGKRYNQ